MGAKKDLKVGAIDCGGMHESLKHRDAVLGAVACVPECGERQFMRRFDRQIELAVFGYAFVLRVGEAATGGPDHAIELNAGRRFDLEQPGPYQIVELAFSHVADHHRNR